jgi:7-cyano-7-deazaguanine synthase
MQHSPRRKRAIILLSGGLDSTTMLALAASEGYELHALTFIYGQRHAVEVEMARLVAARYAVESHRVIHIDLRAFGGSALTSEDIAVPMRRSRAQISHGIPVTYVPARNTIFLAYALAAAEVLEAGEIFVGINAVDYSGYPDCRPEYVKAFETLASLATKAAVEGTQKIAIRTPLLQLSKGEIITLGESLGVDYSCTVSCYNPNMAGDSCGLCDACQLRLRGFAEAGSTDPAVYQQHWLS